MNEDDCLDDVDDDNDEHEKMRSKCLLLLVFVSASLY